MNEEQKAECKELKAQLEKQHEENLKWKEYKE